MVSLCRGGVQWNRFPANTAWGSPIGASLRLGWYFHENTRQSTGALAVEGDLGIEGGRVNVGGAALASGELVLLAFSCKLSYLRTWANCESAMPSQNYIGGLAGLTLLLFTVNVGGYVPLTGGGDPIFSLTAGIGL